MRNLLIIILLFAVGLSASGQAANQIFATDSTRGNENIYFTGTKEAGIYQGVAGFFFQSSKDDATAYFQGTFGSSCASCWENIDTVSITGSAVVNNIVYQSPPLYKNYRLWVDGSVGDTCVISNARYFLKY
jgi:hypothetical protein